MAEPVNSPPSGSSCGSLNFLAEKCPSLLELECMAQDGETKGKSYNGSENRKRTRGAEIEEQKKFRQLKVTEMHRWMGWAVISRWMYVRTYVPAGYLYA